MAPSSGEKHSRLGGQSHSLNGDLGSRDVDQRALPLLIAERGGAFEDDGRVRRYSDVAQDNSSARDDLIKQPTNHSSPTLANPS